VENSRKGSKRVSTVMVEISFFVLVLEIQRRYSNLDVGLSAKEAWNMSVLLSIDKSTVVSLTYDGNDALQVGGFWHI
jgi:hypothetical protein